MFCRKVIRLLNFFFLLACFSCSLIINVYAKTLATPSNGYSGFRKLDDGSMPSVLPREPGQRDFDNPSNGDSFRSSGVYEKYFDLQKHAFFVMEFVDEYNRKKYLRYPLKFSYKDGNLRAYNVDVEIKPSTLFSTATRFYLDLNYRNIPRKNFYNINGSFLSTEGLLLSGTNLVLSDNTSVDSSTVVYNFDTMKEVILNNQYFSSLHDKPIKFKNSYVSARLFFQLKDIIDLQVFSKHNNHLHFTFTLCFKGTTVQDDAGNTVRDNSGVNQDMGSNISDMSENIGGMKEALEEVVNTQNQIIKGIQNLIQHISNQLFAFWNQLAGEFTNLYAKLEKNANDNFTALKEAFDDGSTLIANYISKNNRKNMDNNDKNTDKALNSYNNSSMNNDNETLKNKIAEQDGLEKQITSKINEPLSSFEFKNPVNQYLLAFGMCGQWLQNLFDSLGDFKDVVNLSFAMTIALICIGMYRFKGGA